MATEETQISTEDVRQGETGNGVRYVLAISVLLAVVALGIAVSIFSQAG